MMHWVKLIRVEWLIAAFCAWHCSDLIHAWLHSPYDRFGWIALLLWLLPAVRSVSRRVDSSRQFKLALTGLALTLIGVMGDLNFLAYCGFAATVGAIAGVSGRAWLWLVLAICWMPAFGLICSKLNLHAPVTQALRLVVAAGAAGIGFYLLAPPVRKTSA